ncbi:SUN domain-containing protein 2-like isoform X2 [Thrips palmi]|nr:SUN domain-containing protein 2-like isoform X2 [Thrips palmi]XP_034243627.1 SUN domain-containing protein 2-like isoform X2 [Thrips palmi]XP_034243628.1 SUN domain-containing protein 2-like isoform X2 [Thrips palmi]
MTLPNMSRSGLHSTNQVNHHVAAKSHFNPSRLNYSDSFCSDSDEVDDSRLAYNRRQGQKSTWMIVKSTVSSFMMSIFTFLITTTNSFYTSFSQRRKVPPAQRAQHYYSYIPKQEGLLSRIQTHIYRSSSWIYRNVFHDVFNDAWSTSSRQSTWASKGVTRKSRFLRLLPLLLLLLLLGFIVWWLWDDSSSVPPKMTEEQTSSWIWNVLTFPLSMIHSLFSSVFHGMTVPFSPSSFEGLISVLYDIVLAPWNLLVSVGEVLVSFGWSIISLFQMIMASFLNFKINLWESRSDYQTSDSGLPSFSSNEAQSDSIKALIRAALQNQEASILSKMSKSEEGIRAEVLSKIARSEDKIRAELIAKQEHGQQLNAKIVSLQNELRRWKRRYMTCCRVSDPVSAATFKEKLHDELKQLFSSPEGLVLLGAVAAHLTPVDKAPANIVQFNDTEIRLWISSTFLDKDDFERKMANMTKYFNEELERRSAEMMGASVEEIKARIANESQMYLAQMSKLRAEVSSSYMLHNDHLQSGTRFSGQSISGWDESRVRMIVQSALALYDADKTGMADYALESQGGQVISTRCTETYQVKSPTLSVFGVPLWYPSNSPRTVIQPGMHPGECWAFVGSQGYLVIQLSHRILVQGFTYEHISPVLLPTGKMDSAPKEFSIYGLRAEGDHDPILLGNYHYLQNSTSMQYFPVQRSGVQPLQLIEIQVKSNHGNINYTCMYRFRVHGKIA